MNKIIIYTTPVCPYCTMAKRLLTHKGITTWTDIDASKSREVWQEMQEKTGRRTVPQIFIGKTFIGGYTDMIQLDKEGALDSLLNEAMFDPKD